MPLIKAKRTHRRTYKRKGRAKKTHVPVRSRRMMTYHGRKGYPIIHRTEDGRKYIMVRHPSGRGVKRLYLKRGRVPAKERK